MIVHPAALAAGLSTLMLAAGSVFGQASLQGPINENFDINVSERRITESPFHRGSEISADSGSLRLRIGAAVDAGTIDVTIRGVSGQVSFRADLSSISDRLKRLADLGNGRR